MSVVNADTTKVTSKSDFANKFYVGCWAKGLAEVTAEATASKQSYVYFGLGFTTVDSAKTGGAKMEGGVGVINTLRSVKGASGDAAAS